ncbi:MAG: hypothetical protein LBT32_00860 [Peptococcaceae bacterium]|jgi:hypothetical protein|nr:hypothetical protein [Peptococcaceae bacterium]
MKFKKKAVMTGTFVLAVLLVATTVLADIADKNGYEQLKDGVKATAQQCAEGGFASYTLLSTVELKDNGTVMVSDVTKEKLDWINNATETTNVSISPDNHYSHYRYEDPQTVISSEDRSDSIYYVNEYPQGHTIARVTNPFDQDEMSDVERIIDALASGLQDYVVVDANPDGSVNLAGSLGETQIPALFNALASFVVKQKFRGVAYPALSKDVFIQSVNGTAKINENGILERIQGQAVLSGTDEQGAVHEITVDVLIELSDINATTVQKPDLSGKTVETQIRAESGEFVNTLALETGKFVGTYKNDILMDKDGKLFKVGERHLVIDSLTREAISGRYYEVYKAEYSALTDPDSPQYAGAIPDFTYSVAANQERADLWYELPADGMQAQEQRSIWINQADAKVQFFSPYTNNIRSVWGDAVILRDTVLNPEFD